MVKSIAMAGDGAVNVEGKSRGLGFDTIIKHTRTIQRTLLGETDELLQATFWRAFKANSSSQFSYAVAGTRCAGHAEAEFIIAQADSDGSSDNTNGSSSKRRRDVLLRDSRNHDRHKLLATNPPSKARPDSDRKGNVVLTVQRISSSIARV